MHVIRSLCIAFSTYSRIPVPQVAWTDENRKYSMCFFPLIGAVIGLLLWGWLALCDVLGFGALLRGAVGALLPILVTGGIHMDGFMDTSDALASWQSPENGWKSSRTAMSERSLCWAVRAICCWTRRCSANCRRLLRR